MVTANGSSSQETQPVGPPICRSRIFLDFWNFQIGMNESFGPQFRLDWCRLTGHLVSRLTTIHGLGAGSVISCEEMRVYLSVNPKSPKEVKLKAWAGRFLERLPGVFVNVVERRDKEPPRCPSCYTQISV